jgi:hypothetical protein
MRNLAAVVGCSLALFSLAEYSYAAMSENAIWEIRPTVGSPSNAGCFVLDQGSPSPSASATLAIDSGSGASNVWVSSSAHSFASGDVMKYLKVIAGTSWSLGEFQILAVGTSPGGVANSAKLDHSPSALANSHYGTYSLYPGVDYSQQAAAQLAINGTTVTATSSGSTVTFTGGYTPSNNDYGNCVQFTNSGGAVAGVYYISGVSGSTWTVTGATTLGTSTGLNGNEGGAMDVLATVSGYYAIGNKIWHKNTGTDTTAATFSIGNNSGQTPPPTRIQSYYQTRGDTYPGNNDANRSVLQATATNETVLTLSGAGILFSGFIVNCNSYSGTVGIADASPLVMDTKVINCASKGVNVTASNIDLNYLEITGGLSGCTAAVYLGNAVGVVIDRSNIHDNLCTGIAASGTPETEVVTRSLVTYNTGATSDGINLGGYNNVVLGNTIAGNGRWGVSLGDQTLLRNNIIVANATAGLACYTAPGIAASWFMDGNVYYGNGTNRLYCDDGTVTLTTSVNGASPYVDFQDTILSNDPFVSDAPGGAGNFTVSLPAAYGKGAPPLVPGSNGADYRDAGVFQHQTGQAASIQ